MAAPARNRSADALALALLLAASVAMTWPLALHLGTHVASDLADPLYSVYALAWDARALGHGLQGFAQANIFYPHASTFLYGDTLLALGAIGAPITALSGNPVLAYNVLYILSFFLCGLGMYVLAKRISGSRPAAFLAALVFAFFPYRFAHISHLEILYFGWIPLLFLFLHKSADRPSFGNLIGAAVFFLFQALSCAYYGEFAAGFAFLAGLYLALRSRAWRSAAPWLRTAIVGTAAGLVLLAYFWPFIRLHARMLFERPLWEVGLFSAQLQHYLAVPPWNVLWGKILGRLGTQESQLFPGLAAVVIPAAYWLSRARSAARRGEPAIAGRRRFAFRLWDVLNLALFGFLAWVLITGGAKGILLGLPISAHRAENPAWLLIASLAARVLSDGRARRAWARRLSALPYPQGLYAALAGLAVLLSFGPVIRVFDRAIMAGPYALFYRFIPGFRNLRVPSRFAVLAVLGLAVLLACGVAAFLRSRRQPAVRRLAVVLCAGLIAAEYVSVPLPLVEVDPGGAPEIYGAVKEIPPAAPLIELPMPARDREESQEAGAVYHSTFHWRPIVNGYSGFAPPAYRIVREAMLEFPSERTFRLLENLGVKYVLVRSGAVRPRAAAGILDGLTGFPGRVELVRAAGGDALFRLLPGAGEPGEPPEAFSSYRAGDRTAWRAAANKNNERTGAAFDGDLATAWSTGYPQQSGDVFRLDMGGPRLVSRVEAYLGRGPLDYPRSYVVEGSTDGETWLELARGSGGFPDVRRSTAEDFSRYAMTAAFAPAEIRHLRIRLVASHEARHWSIAELVVR